MERSCLLCAFLFLFAVPAVVFAEGKRPLRIEDLFHFERLTDPQVSPDGSSVAYVVATVDLQANKTSSSLWIAPTSGKKKPWQLTRTTSKDRHPRWSPDGTRILFESNRSGDNQLWIIDLHGGEAHQLTTLSTEASNGLWSPDGKWIAFVSAVYPEYSHRPFAESEKANRKRKEEREKGPVKARIHTRLFYRHWDSYVEDKRQHLLVMPAAGGEPRDVTPGDRDANPTSNTFSLGDDFTFSPDSSHLLFTAPPERNEAWSTNHEICRVPVAGGKMETLTDNPAADASPRFSPDGKYLAYRAQKRPGFEADRWQLLVVPTEPDGSFQDRPHSVTADFDASTEAFVWDARGQHILFCADQKGSVPLFAASRAGGKVRCLSSRSTTQSPSVGGREGAGELAFLRVSMTQPAEVFVARLASSSGDDTVPTLEERPLTQANRKLLDKLDLPQPESVDVKVEGAVMQMWILRPPGFDPDRKWPLVYLVHGGPQGAWEDGWSYRWNPELWAAQGYVIALPNPRGSTGFGQKFVDAISGDWGGKCYDDLMAGVDYLEKLPYIDSQRMAAAGASFGGYMMNWFQGNTTRFKTLITHCGVYNFDSMYALTDELWFDEWEHGGPPWGPSRESYEKHSPHRRASHFKTPMLIIHNDLDFRVPVSEGHQLFTTLQRLGIPSRFLNFPDEGHWVLKPRNSELWHKEVFTWLKKYVPPGGK